MFILLVFISIGLILSFHKVKNSYTNWMFFNKFSVYVVTSILLLSTLPYDLLTTDYNINHSKITDLYYLLILENPDYYLIKSKLDSEKGSMDKHYDWLMKKIYKKEMEASEASLLSYNVYLNSFK